MKRYVMLALVPFLFCAALQGEKLPDITTVVQKMDELYRSKSSYSQLEMNIVTPNWQRTLKLNAWSQGMKNTFMRILSPAKEKGVATLRVGNEMWNYLPKTNKVIKIPPSMMMSSWMGSDFTNDDLVKESTMIEDYTFNWTKVENPQPGNYYINFTPKPDKAIVWGKIVGAVRRSDYLPVWYKYYDERGKLMRVLSFRNIQTFDGKKIPAVMEMVPQNKKGHKTTIRYNSLRFNISHPEKIFTLRNIKSRQ